MSPWGVRETSMSPWKKETGSKRREILGAEGAKTSGNEVFSHKRQFWKISIGSLDIPRGTSLFWGRHRCFFEGDIVIIEGNIIIFERGHFFGGRHHYFQGDIAFFEGDITIFQGDGSETLVFRPQAKETVQEEGPFSFMGSSSILSQNTKFRWGLPPPDLRYLTPPDLKTYSICLCHKQKRT